MDPSLYLAFIVATAIMILLPGPSIMLTVSHSMTFGPRRALTTVYGVTFAVSIQLAVALAGMTSFMILLAEWFEWLRWFGVAYLVYLGIERWRAVPTEDESSSATRSSRSLFAQGFLVTIANPKTLIFLAAFFPQFIDPNVALAQQLPILAPTFLAITFSFTALWAVAVGYARGAFRSRRSTILGNRVAGGLIIGAAAGLAMARRT
jgi:threonine/homoserine/homoserine lactone efflux protein